jgi:hypothetical protein
VVDEVALPQRAGEKRFSSIVQLLERPGGERLVRFAYATDGTARRGPVTLRASDVARLRKEGVRFRNEITGGLGGKQILLEDPSGNTVELFQPG